MSDHIPDPTKMISDTPRTDAAYFKPDATMYDLAGEMKRIERELNAANDRIKRLEEAANETIKLAAKHIKQLVDGGDEAIYKTNLFDRELHWNKAKEANP
jgi:predicted  nucleic acid-binding Zn-ribbon protein